MRASLSLLEALDNSKILLIHLGGLGDVCLSESLFFSFRKHYGDCIVGLGNKRFLDLFSDYFLRVEGVESRKWLYLFSEKLDGPKWRGIIFIGKDREGILRSRWQKFSEEKIIFVDMYPEHAFKYDEGSSQPQQYTGDDGIFNFPGEQERVAQSCPEEMEEVILLAGEQAQAPLIEIYQLEQLEGLNIKPCVKTVFLKISPRVILYPEKSFKKEKWHHENVMTLYRSLKARGVNVIVFESLGLSLNVDNKVFFEDLVDVKTFFLEGGTFISNDSGMAHLAGASGLFTITLFAGFDPAIWHPRGRNISLLLGRDIFDSASLEAVIMGVAATPDFVP